MFRFQWLTPRFNMDGGAVSAGAESIPAAGGSEIPASEASETGAEQEVAAEPEKQNNFEKAFAKRLSDAQSKWEADKQAEIQKMQDQYKDYDVHRKASEYLQKQHGINDVMTLKEQLELADLTDRAEKQNLDPETLRRIDQLEQKAARADDLEREREEQQQTKAQQDKQAEWEKTYFDGLNEFAKEKGVEADAVTQFMVENGLLVNPEDMTKSFNIALKAMKHDELVKQVEEAEKNGMRKVLQAKGSIPTIQGSKGQGQTITAAPKTMAEARQRAMQRDFSNNQ